MRQSPIVKAHNEILKLRATVEKQKQKIESQEKDIRELKHENAKLEDQIWRSKKKFKPPQNKSNKRRGNSVYDGTDVTGVVLLGLLDD